jgi:hypothetical protein
LDHPGFLDRGEVVVHWDDLPGELVGIYKGESEFGGTIIRGIDATYFWNWYLPLSGGDVVREEEREVEGGS